MILSAKFDIFVNFSAKGFKVSGLLAEDLIMMMMMMNCFCDMVDRQ